MRSTSLLKLWNDSSSRAPTGEDLPTDTETRLADAGRYLRHLEVPKSTNDSSSGTTEEPLWKEPTLRRKLNKNGRKKKGGLKTSTKKIRIRPRDAKRKPKTSPVAKTRGTKGISVVAWLKVHRPGILLIVCETHKPLFAAVENNSADTLSETASR